MQFPENTPGYPPAPPMNQQYTMYNPPSIPSGSMWAAESAPLPPMYWAAHSTMHQGDSTMSPMSQLDRPRRAAYNSLLQYPSPPHHPKSHARTNIDVDIAKEGYIHGNELYCVCKQPYDSDRFMIGCDLCDGWYHAGCVNISEDTAKLMESYICPNCFPKQQELLRSPEPMPAVSLAPMKAVKARESQHSEQRPRRSRRAATKNIDYEIRDDAEEEEYGPSPTRIRSFVHHDVFEASSLSEADDSDVYMSSEDELNDTLGSVQYRFDEDEESFDIDLTRVSVHIGKSKIYNNWDRKVTDEILPLVHSIFTSAFPKVEYAKAVNDLQNDCQAVLVQLTQFEAYVKHREIISSYESSFEKFMHIPKNLHPICEWSGMLNCLGCLALVPSKSYMNHLHECVQDLSAVFKADWTPSYLICGFPLEDVFTSHKAIKLCPSKRKECHHHCGWDIIKKLELMRNRYLTEQKLHRLEILCNDLEYNYNDL